MKQIKNILPKISKTVITAVMALIFLFSLIPAQVSADNRFVVDPTGKHEGLAAFLYDNKTGLPTSEANAIATTSDGFLWIGSYGGLIRYDGSTFERFSSKTGIASVVGLFVDSNNNLWIGTNDNGAAVIDRFGNIKMYSKRDGLPSALVKTFAEDESGNIYAGTAQGVVIFDKEGSLSVINDPRILDTNIRCLETGVNGITYALTVNGDIFTLKNGQLLGYYRGEEDLGVKSIHSLLTDPEEPGNLILGDTESRIWYGNLTDGFPKDQKLSVKDHGSINSMKVIDGDLWVCATEGIFVFKKDSTEPKALENIPMNSNIEYVTTDYQGNLWFASSKQGVMKLVPNRFTDIFDHYGLADAVV